MAESIVAGVSYQVSDGQNYGGMNGYALGNQYSMSIASGEAEVTVSVMFTIDGNKEYSTITVGKEGVQSPVPAGATYYEFNVQGAKVTGEVALFQMQVWKVS